MTASVCVFVCPRAHLCDYTSDLYQIFVHVTYSHGSILPRRRCDMLCTSGYMDNIILASQGSVTWPLS